MPRDDTSHSETEQRILEERALALAETDDNDVDTEFVQTVIVRCGHARLAIETRSIDEIRPVEHLTAVPGAPEEWAGLMNLRGVIHAIVDGPRFLGVEGDRSSTPQVVIFGSNNDALGFLVDEVEGLDRIAVRDLRPPLDATPSWRGITRAITPAMIPLLDVDKILDDPVLQQASREETR